MKIPTPFLLNKLFEYPIEFDARFSEPRIKIDKNSNLFAEIHYANPVDKKKGILHVKLERKGPNFWRGS